MKKNDSILWALRDRTKKPDALGFQPIDPKLWAAAVRAMDRRDRE